MGKVYRQGEVVFREIEEKEFVSASTNWSGAERFKEIEEVKIDGRANKGREIQGAN